MMAVEKMILLDYYEGAYGPTIRIDVHSIEDLIRIKNLFLQLADSSRQAVNLAQMEGLRATGLNQLILRWVADKQELKKRLVLISNTNRDISVEWAMSSKGWKRAAGLIDGLVLGKIPTG